MLFFIWCQWPFYKFGRFFIRTLHFWVQPLRQPPNIIPPLQTLHLTHGTMILCTFIWYILRYLLSIILWIMIYVYTKKSFVRKHLNYVFLMMSVASLYFCRLIFWILPLLLLAMSLHQRRKPTIFSDDTKYSKLLFLNDQFSTTLHWKRIDGWTANDRWKINYAGNHYISSAYWFCWSMVSKFLVCAFHEIGYSKLYEGNNYIPSVYWFWWLIVSKLLVQAFYLWI